MTVREAIDRVDAIKPNAFDDNAKLAWLNELEGDIQVQIHGLEPEDLTAYQLPANSAAALLVPAPFDRLYPLRLGAMVDFANGEYDKYQNSMAMANGAYQDYAAWYIRKHPKGGGRYFSNY